MSKYTTEVRYICEQLAGLSESADGLDVDSVISVAQAYVFDEYPIFDSTYRAGLNAKILKHYYTREIGAETYGLWRLWLNRKMSEIMPYYNQMYESAQISFDPMKDVNVTRSHEGTDSGSRSNTGSSSASDTSSVTESAETWNKYAETPQGGLSGVEDGTYLTNATQDTTSGSRSETKSNNGNTSFSETSENENEWSETLSGKQGTASYSQMLKEYRDTFVNIDMMIIDELSDLFMNIW